MVGTAGCGDAQSDIAGVGHGGVDDIFHGLVGGIGSDKVAGGVKIIVHNELGVVVVETFGSQAHLFQGDPFA